ncbi:hypothetical protein F5Y13DRAFT_191364 [Hypoxylon sp. FL1857]|nr:hypothetical protein F5Y13DRAFT_191364 [Hypoxylon sp. FL1857]
MKPCLLTFYCSVFLASLSEASPRGGGLFDRDGDRSASSSRGGVAINIDEVKNAGGTTIALPAVSNASAEWNVPWTDNSYTGYGHYLRQFVSIQGTGCADGDMPPALLVGTTACRIDGNASAYFWYQWYPGLIHYQPRPDLEVNPGDQMRVSSNRRVIIGILTPSKGYIKNMNTGVEYSMDVTPDEPSDTTATPNICLGGGAAIFGQEWTFQYQDDRQTIPLFQNVTFTNVVAQDRGGKSYDLSTGSVEYRNLVSNGREVEIPEQIDGKSFVIYSPEGEGRTWGPSAKI